MDYEKLTDSYTRGKHIIVFIMVIISLIGITLDTYTYYYSYPAAHLYLQYFCIAVCAISLALVIISIKKYYKIAYLSTVYSIILAILSTSLFYDYFVFDDRINQSFIGLRDAYFMIIFTAISGFIINNKHVVIQGVLLNALIFYYTFYIGDTFFLDNAFVNIITSVGFIMICFFLVRMVNRFTDGLNQSMIETQKRHKINQLRTTKLSAYQNALVKLTNADALHVQNLNNLYLNICKIASDCLGVNRVSIWLLEEKGSSLVRKTLYANKTKDDEVIVLNEIDYPTYFNFMRTQLFIKANNVYTHEATRGFTSIYLEPLNICSMLDCLFRLDGEPAGVICCESQGEFVSWTTEDVLFIQSLADYVAIAHKNQQIQQLLEEIRTKNINLEAQVNENQIMNEELNSLNDELMTVNESLEKAVHERTSTLQLQNEQLTEYAFINSHLLRAPIARILGLANIITNEVELQKDKQMLEALSLATEELDDIVRRISDVLYDSNNVSRSDIKKMINKNMEN